jgi:hypothetical protein
MTIKMKVLQPVHRIIFLTITIILISGCLPQPLIPPAAPDRTSAEPTATVRPTLTGTALPTQSSTSIEPTETVCPYSSYIIGEGDHSEAHLDLGKIAADDSLTLCDVLHNQGKTYTGSDKDQLVELVKGITFFKTLGPDCPEVEWQIRGSSFMLTFKGTWVELLIGQAPPYEGFAFSLPDPKAADKLIEDFFSSH